MTTSLTKAVDGEVLAGRYALEHVLGRGGQGVTFLAEDRREGQTVVVKEFEIDLADDWKAVELFEREARLLERLDHEAIPAHVDTLEVDLAGKTRRFLVREYVEGDSFLELIERGHHMRLSEAMELTRSVLVVLDYIHNLDPPVIHRDIKPSNLIRRSDGRVALIDFGIAQERVAPTVGGSTLVGSPGYVAPEQLAGRATPASDLYSLGATLVHLLAHRHPATLSVQRLRLQFRDVVPVTADFADFLDELLAPDPGARISRAREAMVRLRFDVDDGATSLAKSPSRKAEQAGGTPPSSVAKPMRSQIEWIDGELPPLPHASSMEVVAEPERVEVVFFGPAPEVDLVVVVMMGIFFVTVIPLGMTGLGNWLLVIVPVWIFAMLFWTIRRSRENRMKRVQKLIFTDDGVEIVLRSGRKNNVVVPSQRFGGMELQEGLVDGRNRAALAIDRGEPGPKDGVLSWERYYIVERHLSHAERDWLLDVFGRR